LFFCHKQPATRFAGCLFYNHSVAVENIAYTKKLAKGTDMGGYIVYADVVLALNFFLDFFLLWAAGCFLRRETTLPRLLAASALGALYGAGLLLPSLAWLYRIPAVVAISLVLLLAAYSWKGYGAFFRLLAVFYLIAFAMAGAVLAGSRILAGQGIAIGMQETVRGASLLFGLVMAMILARRGVALIKRNWQKEDFRVSLEIWLAGRSCSLNALIDTGNDLREPLSALPVIVADYRAVKALFPERLRAAWQLYHDDAALLVQTMAESGDAEGWGRRLRLVPFASIGKKHGLLPGFRPDRLFITQNGQRQTADAYICIAGRGFSAGIDYQAVINPEVFAHGAEIKEAVGI